MAIGQPTTARTLTEGGWAEIASTSPRGRCQNVSRRTSLTTIILRSVQEISDGTGMEFLHRSPFKRFKCVAFTLSMPSLNALGCVTFC
eukprot:scaffold1868_cov165-Skeletonema_menzelii.AAC.3